MRGPWERFTIYRSGGPGAIQSGDAVYLQADNGMYWCAEGGGGGVINANRTSVGAWETFQVAVDFNAGPSSDSVFIDVNGDGVPDELFKPGTYRSLPYISYVDTYCYDYEYYDFNVTWDPWGYDWDGLWDFTQGFSWIFSPDQFWIYESAYSYCDTYVEPALQFQTEENYEYKIFRDPTGSSAFNPANWQVVGQGVFGHGLQNLDLGYFDVNDIYLGQYWVAKLSKPLSGAVLRNVAGTVLSTLPIVSTVQNVGITLPLPAGASLTIQVEDVLGYVFGDGGGIKWRINGGSWNVGGTVNLASGAYTLNIQIGDGNIYTITVIIGEVVLTAAPGNIHRGFDPPLPGAPPFGENDPSNEYWASVIQGQSNTIVNLVASSAAYAGLLEFKYRDDADQNYVASSPWVSLQKTDDFTQETTGLVINGTSAGGNAIKEPVIDLVNKNTNEVKLRLHVMVLPLRTVPASVYAVQDTASLGTVFTNSPTISVPSGTAVVNVLNDVFHQAGVSFTLANPYDELQNVTYDTKAIVFDSNAVPQAIPGDPSYDSQSVSGMDGRIMPREDVDLFQSSEFQTECPLYPIESLVLNRLGIVFVKNSGWVYPTQRSFWVRGFSPSVALANSAGYAELAAAHEMGHQLGLSTEDDRHDVEPYPPGVVGDNPGNVPPSVPQNPVDPHLPTPGYAIMLDGSPVPDIDGAYKLPWLHGRWMKHEDWREANNSAVDYQP